MSVPAPHFLLRARANRLDRPGRWCFMLESHDGSHSMKVEDDEPDTCGERLELLALVRGLEAVPQPAHVTVVATSRYVNRVLNGGLDEWRDSGWQWERHGEMVPVKNADLWRRVDRALHFHKVDCRSTGGAATACHDAGHPQRRPPGRSGQMPDEAFVVSKSHSAGAPSATSHKWAAATSPRVGRAHRHKSLSRNAIAFGAVLRRRFRQTCRRWRSALERFAAADVVEWAD